MWRNALLISASVMLVAVRSTNPSNCPADRHRSGQPARRQQMSGKGGFARAAFL
jgi:hypothetical protein